MTITIHIHPELEAELNRQAAAHGVEVSAYAATLLQAATHRENPLTLNTESTATVVRRMATFGKRHGLSLGGSTVKEFLRESRL
jgi:hypothetical protein